MQQILLRSVELKVRSCSLCEGGVTVLRAKALDDALRVLFLVYGDRSFFGATRYIHAGHFRRVTHVCHLETVHKVFLELVQQQLVRWRQTLQLPDPWIGESLLEGGSKCGRCFDEDDVPAFDKSARLGVPDTECVALVVTKAAHFSSHDV